VRASVLLCLGIFAIVWMPHFAGAAPSSEPVKYSFKIESQPLGEALQEFAKQCGVQIIFFSQVTEGLQAPALNAQYTIAAGLQILLSGSKLTFRVINPKTIEIHPLTAADPLDRAVGRSAKGARPVREDGPNDQDLKKTLLNFASMDEIVVDGRAEGLVATRTETPLREIPQTISIISKEQMRQENDTDLGEALAHAIGITAQRYNSLSPDLLARGFPIATFHLDGGAALNSFDSSTSAFLGAPDLNEFDRIEVLRGADGLFGGDGDPGATINLIRKRALYTPQLTLSLSGGSWNNYRVEADVTGPLGFDGALRGRLDVAFVDRKYFYDTASLDRTKIFGVIEYDLSPHTLVTVGGSMQWDNALPFVGGMPRASNGEDPHLPRNSGFTFNWASSNTRTREIYVQLTQQFDPRWKIKINATSWNQSAEYDLGAFTPDFGPVSSELLLFPSFLFTARPNTLDQLAFDATLTGSFDAFGRRVDLAVGADWLRFRGSRATEFPYGGADPPGINAYAYNPSSYPDPRLSNQPVEEVDSHPDSDQRAVFGSIKLYLNSALAIIGGARVSRDTVSTVNAARLGEFNASASHRFKTPTKTTPYAGVVYNLGQHYSLYASYADIYQSNGFARTLGGSFLPPIDGINIELGLKGAWHDGTLNATLALYGIEQRGLPLTDVETDDPAFGLYGCCYVARGILRSKGADLELNGQLAPGWLLGAGYTYNTNYGYRDAALPGATPRHLFKLWTSKQLPAGLQRWTIDGHVQAQSSSSNSYEACIFDAQADCVDYATFKAVQSSYAIVSLRASYAIDSHWRVALDVNNVFDHTYYESLGSTSGDNWYGEPRNFMVRIDGKY
jgi:outer membrane receptor for ferric coprogen and ferric-rhodotorulic acid